MEFLQETNPLLLLLVISLAYLLAYLFRRDIKSSLLFLAIILLLGLLLSPGGQAIAEKTQYLKTPEERLACLGKSLIHGGLWQKQASQKYCLD